MKKINIKHYLLLFIVGINSILNAQTNIGKYAFNGDVLAIECAPDGSTFVGGSFTTVGLYTGNGVSMDMTTGSWSHTDVKVEGEINSAIAIPDSLGGGWYIGGVFTRVNGEVRNCLARINADGTLHTFAPNINSLVSALALDTVGNLFVGGLFSSIGGVTRNRIAKFDNTGTLTSFNPNINGWVRTLVFDASGNLYLGGDFTIIDGITRNRLAKFDNSGTLLSFNPNFNNKVYAITIDANENLFVGGDFSSVGGSSRFKLAKFDNTGVLTNFWPSFDYSVRALAVDKNSSLYVGGDFSMIGGSQGTVRNRLAKFDSTGVLTSFDPNMGGGSMGNFSVFALAVDTIGSLYVGGQFTTVGGVTIRNRLAKFDSVGNLMNFSPELDWDVNVIALGEGGKIYVGGKFTTVDRVIRNNIAKFDNSGVLTSFDPNINNTVYALALDENENIYVGGNFTTVGGTTIRNRLAKFDNTGSLLNFNPNISNSGTKTAKVYALLIDLNGNLYVGGLFDKVGSTTRRNIAKFNNTEVLTSFSPNISGASLSTSVLALTLDSDGGVYVGGLFTTVSSSITRNCLAKFDNMGVLTNFDPNINGATSGSTIVSSLTIDADDNLYVGGNFTDVGGTTRNRLAKFDNNGVLTSFDPNMNNWVSSLLLDFDRNLYVGGDFSSVGGTTSRTRLAKFDSTGVLTSFNPYLSNTVNALAIDGCKNLHVGGRFTPRYAYFASTTTPPTVVSVTPETICGVGTLELGATPSSGIVNWYNAETGGALLGTGTTFTTPSIPATTTYYAEADNGGCVSDIRTPVVATILNPAIGTDFQTTCNAYTWIDGNTYTSNNDTATFNILGGAANGCDSLVTLDLTFNPSTGTDVQSTCNAYTWIDGNTYTSNNNSATFNIIGGASNGCDSLVTLDLTINSVTDTSTTVENETITANLLGVNYQWLDCDNGNAPILGETNQSYTASEDGTYAVEISENGCVAISNCTTILSTSIENLNFNEDFKAYPNPTNGIFNISIPEGLIGNKITLTNTLGQIIGSKTINSILEEYDLSNFADGIYFIQLQTQNGLISKKILKN